MAVCDFHANNREDLGNRYRLIEIPYTTNAKKALEDSKAYRDYFEGLDKLNEQFAAMNNDL